MKGRIQSPIPRTLLLGALLAAGWWAMRGPPDTGREARVVEVTEAQVRHLRERWERQWNRPPTPEELRGAIDAHVQNEILYREALALGLDRLDPRVRLALAQKMRMLTAARAEAREVGGDDLAAFYALRQDQYRIPANLSFVHLFFRGEDGQNRAAERTAALREHEPDVDQVLAMGDPFILDPVQQDVGPAEVARRFGVEFADALTDGEPDMWLGPVPSSFGHHAVKIFAWTPERLPPLEEVRDRVLADLRREAGRVAEEQGYLEIAARYEVRFTPEARKEMGGDGP